MIGKIMEIAGRMKKARRKAPETATVARYTESAWKRTRPESNRDEWEAATVPRSFERFLETAEAYVAKESGAARPSRLRIVTIDEEYFGWLEARGAEDGVETRAEYSMSVSDEDAARLAAKNGLDLTAAAYVAIVAAFGAGGNAIGKTAMRMDEDARAAVEKGFEAEFGEGNAKVPGYVLRLEDAFDDADALDAMAGAWAADGVVAGYGRWGTQEPASEANLACYCVPAYVKSKADGATFPFDGAPADDAEAGRRRSRPLGEPAKKALEAAFMATGRFQAARVRGFVFEPRDLGGEKAAFDAELKKEASRRNVPVREVGRGAPPRA